MYVTRVPLADRFWAKVSKTDTCWLWTAAKTGQGYGHIKVDGRMRPAHRVSYELAIGPIPEGMDLDHLCRTPLCVRPDHLEPVTRRTNVLRGVGYCAQQARKEECVNGHAFTAANTYIWRGHRTCRKCNIATTKRMRERRRAS